MNAYDIRRIRFYWGGSQARLASQAGVSTSTWGRWERGKLKPSASNEETLHKMVGMVSPLRKRAYDNIEAAMFYGNFARQGGEFTGLATLIGGT